jgi:predicted nucleic acid-binding protein
MIQVYLDTSALAKLYVLEPETARLSEFVKQQGSSLPYTSLHELELTQVLERRRGDADLSAKEAARIRSLIESDLSHGILTRREISWPDAFSTAIRLLERHARGFGMRSLDSLHLACALANKSQLFVTFDQRQSRAAHAERLKVWPG